MAANMISAMLHQPFTMRGEDGLAIYLKGLADPIWVTWNQDIFNLSVKMIMDHADAVAKRYAEQSSHD